MLAAPVPAMGLKLQPNVDGLGLAWPMCIPTIHTCVPWMDGNRWVIGL